MEPGYQGPYAGIDVQTPEILLGPNATPNSLNFQFRNKELRTCPRIKNVIPHPANSSAFRGLTTFLDGNNVVHTCGITANSLFQLVFREGVTSGNQWDWNKVGDFISNGLDTQYAVQIFLNKVYWTTGLPGVWYWDGMTNSVSEATGPSPTAPKYGGYFLGELGFHLIILNTVEVVGVDNVAFPQRVRWSANGLPLVWNPASNPAAGTNDMYDVPDAITGFMAIGPKGYIFRVNGITQMSFTGRASNPFIFDHMWASDRGIGNAYSQTIANYGPVGIFISTEDIYKITPGNLDAIGGGARDKIICDLAGATGPILSTIIPGYHRKYIYVTYQLVIPSGNNCILWTFSLEDNNWARRVIELGIPSTKMRICSVK